MTRKSKAADLLFQLVVRTPFISILLTLAIGSFIYYSLFVYQIDREYVAEGSFTRSESGDYKLTLITNQEIGGETPNQIFWYSGARKYKAKFQEIIDEKGGTKVIAQPDSDDVINEFGVSNNLNDKVVKGSIVVGKERVLDKIK